MEVGGIQLTIRAFALMENAEDLAMGGQDHYQRGRPGRRELGGLRLGEELKRCHSHRRVRPAAGHVRGQLLALTFRLRCSEAMARAQSKQCRPSQRKAANRACEHTPSPFPSACPHYEPRWGICKALYKSTFYERGTGSCRISRRRSLS